MKDERWADVDDYLESQLGVEDEVLRLAQKAAADAGLPPISVMPLQGKFLHILARLMGARRVLEIGSLGGYSAIWLGRALPPDGKLYTLEVNPHHAQVAGSNIAAAGLSDKVEIVLGADRRLRSGQLRPHLHRRRQAQQRRLFRLGPAPHSARWGHRGRQRRAQWRRG